MSSKKKTTSKTNQTQTSSAPSYALPGLSWTAGQVTDAAREVQAQNPYEGDFYAVADPGQTQGIMDAYTRAGNRAYDLSNQVQGTFDDLQGMNFDMQPFTVRQSVGSEYDPTRWQGGDDGGRLDAAIRAAMDPAFTRLQEEILPGIKSSALASGAYGNSRAMATLPQMAIGDATEAAQRIGADLGYQGFQAAQDRDLAAHTDYERNLAAQRALEQQLLAGDADRRLGAREAELRMQLDRAGLSPGIADTIMRMSASEGDLLTAAQDADIYGRQTALDNALARDDYDRRAPFRGLDVASSLLSQLSAGYGTTTMKGSSTTTEKSSGLGNVLQGALGLGAMAMGMPPGLFGGGPQPAATRGSAAKTFSNVPHYGKG